MRPEYFLGFVTLIIFQYLQFLVDYGHFTLQFPNFGAMETGERQSSEIRVVNQREPNKRRMKFFSVLEVKWFKEETKEYKLFLW